MTALRSSAGSTFDWVTPGCAEGDRQIIEEDLALHADDPPIASRSRWNGPGWRRLAWALVGMALGVALGRASRRPS